MAWSDTLPDEERAYVANKGWDKLPPDAAAVQMMKSYRNLEQMRPAPPPSTAAGYAFEGVTAEPEVLDMARGMAFELKLPPEQATLLAKRLIAIGDEAEATDTAAQTQRLTAAETALKSAWGADYDKNTDVARKAFEQLGLPKETVDTLVTTMGVDKVMNDIGFKLGQKMGEAPMHQGDGTVSDPSRPATTFTRETALERRNSWTPEFMSKYLAGDADATKEWNDVTSALIGGGMATFQAAPENFGRQSDGHGTEIKQGDSRWRG